MNKLSYKPSYKRRLPHLQPEGSVFFITSRLAGSLPLEVIERLRQEKEEAERGLARFAHKEGPEERQYQEHQRLFEKWDDALDELSTDIKYLSDARLADLVSESIHNRDGKVYDLFAFCVMPNHMHLVLQPLKEDAERYYSLSKIMHSLKRYTAQQANLILGRTGEFWQHENYDHYGRNEAELERIIKYVLYNPVRAGLVEKQSEWKWSYSKYDM